MGNKNKQQTNHNSSKETFDVKTNLKKLGASFERGAQFGSGTTEDDYSSSGGSDYGKFISSKDEHDLKTNFELHTLKQDKKISDEIFSLKESVNFKINQDLKEVKTELENKVISFEQKLEKKLDEKIFIWAIGVLLFICSLFGVFSYFPMENNVKELKENQDKINDSLNKINNRVEKLNTILKEKKR